MDPPLGLMAFQRQLANAYGPLNAAIVITDTS